MAAYRFGIVGGPWAPRNHQYGHKGVQNPIFLDLGMVLGPHVERLLFGHRRAKTLFLFKLISRTCFKRFGSRYPDFCGFRDHVSAQKVLRKPAFHRHRCSLIEGRLCRFSMALGSAFPRIADVGTGLAIEDFREGTGSKANGVSLLV